MMMMSVLTVSAGLPVLQQLDSGGTGTLIVRLGWREETEVGTPSVLHGARAAHYCQHRGRFHGLVTSSLLFITLF